mmetsp:Transcript_38400/g.80784  ORF Transcript_38400/g.80784 Transcript_38400/m.80784 type:complete len:232 (-) Transcript_38400:819-1514(-)
MTITCSISFVLLSILLLVCILICFSQRLLDGWIVGIYSRQGPQQLIDKCRILKLLPALRFLLSFSRHRHGQRHLHGRIVIIVVIPPALRIHGIRPRRSLLSSSLILRHRHSQRLLQQGVLVIHVSIRGGRGGRHVHGLGRRTARPLRRRGAVRSSSVLRLLLPAISRFRRGGRGNAFLPRPFLFHADAQRHGQLGIHVGIDASEFGEAVSASSPAASGRGRASAHAASVSP